MRFFAKHDKEVVSPEWVLRAAVFGEFLGFGMFALRGRQDWADWIQAILGVAPATAGSLLVFIGLFDILVASAIIVRPVRAIILVAIVWGFLTAIIQPFVGVPFWDFVGHAANWLTPLALFMVRGFPKKPADWLD